MTASVVNLLIGVVGTPILRAFTVPEGRDSTRHGDYHVEAGDRVERPTPVVEPTM